MFLALATLSLKLVNGRIRMRPHIIPPLSQSESYNDPAGYNNQPGYASHQGPPPDTYNTGNTYNSGPAGGVSLVSSLSISF